MKDYVNCACGYEVKHHKIPPKNVSTYEKSYSGDTTQGGARVLIISIHMNIS